MQMTSKVVARVVGLSAVVFALGGGAAGCGKKSLGGGDDDGAVRVALTLPGGAIVNTVDYQITGPSLATPITGSIDVSAPGTTQATALVSGLAPGMYTVSMTATVVGGSQNCTGTAPFTVVAGQTAMANVTLQCTTPPRTGNGAIVGTIDQ